MRPYILIIVLLAAWASASPLLSACPKLSYHPPATSVHNLRPSVRCTLPFNTQTLHLDSAIACNFCWFFPSLFDKDIKVIAALGDSITAAFAADGLEGGPLEYRGQSWSIGGDPNATTLANFFKNYSPEVQGASLGVHTPEVCLGVEFCPDGQYWPTMDNLNSAQSGAWIQNWPRMFDFLMKQMQSNPKIDYQNDWKVLTVLIGANNLCRGCDPEYNAYDEAAKFEAELVKLVTKLRTIPRVFVNLVSIFNISQVFTLSESYLECRAVHDILGLAECECVFPWTSANQKREEVDNLAEHYRKRIAKVAAQTPQTDSFALVLQPMFSDFRIPDISFLSRLDCFHPDVKAHQQMALGLWRTMYLPQAKKPLSLTFPVPLYCPTDDDILRTN